MSVTPQLLPTISALVALGEFSQDDQLPDTAHIETVSDSLSPAAKQQRTEYEWRSAIAALTQQLNQQLSTAKTTPKRKKPTRRKSTRKAPGALVISGPLPLINEPKLLPKVAAWAVVPHTSPELTAHFNALSPVDMF